MTGFTTADPNLSCLDNEPSLLVYHDASNPAADYVVARTSSRGLRRHGLHLRPCRRLSRKSYDSPAVPDGEIRLRAALKMRRTTAPMMARSSSI